MEMDSTGSVAKERKRRQLLSLSSSVTDNDNSCLHFLSFACVYTTITIVIYYSAGKYESLCASESEMYVICDLSILRSQRLRRSVRNGSSDGQTDRRMVERNGAWSGSHPLPLRPLSPPDFAAIFFSLSWTNPDESYPLVRFLSPD